VDSTVPDLHEEVFVGSMRRLTALLDREWTEQTKADALKELAALLRIGQHSGLTEERTLALVEECLVGAVKIDADAASA
jgi:hypothetical protein